MKCPNDEQIELLIKRIGWNEIRVFGGGEEHTNVNVVGSGIHF